jgi:hypothetical protein
VAAVSEVSNQGIDKPEGAYYGLAATGVSGP